MRLLIILLVILSGCSIGGGGLVDPPVPYTFARVSEQTLIELFQSSEKLFSSTETSSTDFATINECVTTNFLFVNNEKVQLTRTNSSTNEFGTNYFAFDETGRYAVVVAIEERVSKLYEVPDFILSGNNDILVYRLRPVGQDSFRIFTIHSLVSISQQFIDVCISSKGPVFSGEDLTFNRLPTQVSFSFLGRSPI